MKYKFNNCLQDEKDRIKEICNKIRTCSAVNLLIRVSMHRPKFITKLDGSKLKYYRPGRNHGYYRNYFDHFLYDSEVEEIYEKKKCDHIIQLHLKDDESNYSIAKTFAHEWRHYLQFTKLRNRFIKDNGKNKKRIELDARKWSDRRVNKLGFVEK